MDRGPGARLLRVNVATDGVVEPSNAAVAVTPPKVAVRLPATGPGEVRRCTSIGKVAALPSSTDGGSGIEIVVASFTGTVRTTETVLVTRTLTRNCRPASPPAALTTGTCPKFERRVPPPVDTLGVN